jgi:hypothetical protein
VSELFEQLAFEEDDLELIDGWYTVFIAEDKLQECPKVKVTIGNEEINSILDTDCELWDNRMRNLERPVQNMKLLSVLTDRARKVKTQAMLT